MIRVRFNTIEEYAEFIRSTTLYMLGETFGEGEEDTTLRAFFKGLRSMEDEEVIRAFGLPGDLENFND